MNQLISTVGIFQVDFHGLKSKVATGHEMIEAFEELNRWKLFSPTTFVLLEVYFIELNRPSSNKNMISNHIRHVLFDAIEKLENRRFVHTLVFGMSLITFSLSLYFRKSIKTAGDIISNYIHYGDVKNLTQNDGGMKLFDYSSRSGKQN